MALVNQSPTFQLADMILPDGVEKFVFDLRAERVSWRHIAARLAAATDGRVDVTHETVRAWAIELERAS